MSDEKALVERAVEGDARALDALAALHRPRVRRAAAAILADPDLAEDVAQEALLRMQAALPGFRHEAELSTWLHRVTLNLCRDHLRRRRRARETTPLESTSEASLAVHDGTDERLDGERARAAVRAALERLPPEQREAVTLRFLSGLPYREIARVTSTPPGTVASRVFRALARLGEEIESRHLEVIP